MPNQKNIEEVKELKEKVSRAKSIIFADYKGLKANQSTELRDKMAEENSEVEVTKNTLLKLTLKDEGIDYSQVEKSFEGTTLAIFSYKDPLAPLKKLFEFAKSTALPIIKLGLIDGKFYSGPEVKTLSELPGREVLLARVAFGLNSPVRGLVNVLSGSKRNLVYVLKAISEKKQA